MKKKTSDDCVKVVIRCRPLTQKEKTEKQQEIVFVDSKRNEILLRNPDKKGVKVTRTRLRNSHSIIHLNKNVNKRIYFQNVVKK